MSTIHTEESAYEKGMRFQNEVESIYQALGFSTIQNVNMNGQQIDIQAERFTTGIGSVRLAIECKFLSSGTVSNQEVFAFLAFIKGCKDASHLTKGIIVTNTGFSKDARQAASDPNCLALYTIKELENELLNVHEALLAFTKEYERTEIFSQYITQRAVLAKDSWLLTPDAFTNAKSFTMKLVSKSDTFTQFLFRHLSSDLTSQLVSQAHLSTFSPLLSVLLINELNQVIQAASLYEAKRCEHFTLGNYTRTLLEKKDGGPFRTLLNRFLLHDAFPSDIGLPTGTPTTEGDTEIENLLDHVIKVVSQSQVHLITILGDYGVGKTTCLTRLKYLYAKNYLSRGTSDAPARIPLFIKLKDYYNRSEIDQLITYSLHREFERDIPLSVFWRGLRDGLFVVFLDGFDEMAPQVDKAARTDHFISLSKLFTSRSPVLLTCRPSYFVSNEEYEANLASFEYYGASVPISWRQRRRGIIDEDALKRKLMASLSADDEARPIRLTKAESQTINLPGFSEKDIDRYLQLKDPLFRERSGVGWETVKDFLFAIYDIRDLMTRPVLLKMITDTVLEGHLSPKANPESIGPSRLYEIYTSMKLDLDWKKGTTRHFLTKLQRLQFAQSMALAMFDTGRLDVTYDDIVLVLRENPSIHNELHNQLQSATLEEIATDVQTCTFLSRHRDQMFRFEHKSLMEFFVASYFRDRLEMHSNERRFYRFIPKEILFFLGGFGLNDPSLRNALKKRLHGVDEVPEKQVYCRNIGAAILYSSASHQNLVLREIEITHSDLKKCTFVNCELFRLRMSDVHWRQTVWEFSQLNGISFHASDIDTIQLKDVDLSATLADSNGNQWSIENSRIFLLGRNATILGFVVRHSSMTIQGRMNIEDITFSDSKMRADVDSLECRRGELVNCTIHLSGGQTLLSGVLMDNCSIAIGGRLMLASAKLNNCTVVLGPPTNAAITFRETECKQMDVKGNSDSLGNMQAASFASTTLEQCQFLRVTLRLNDCRLNGVAISKSTIGVLGKQSSLNQTTLVDSECDILGPLIMHDTKMTRGRITIGRRGLEGVALKKCALSQVQLQFLPHGNNVESPAEKSLMEEALREDKKESHTQGSFHSSDVRGSENYARLDQCKCEEVLFFAVSLTAEEYFSCHFVDCRGIIIIRDSEELGFDNTGIGWRDSIALIQGSKITRISRSVEHRLKFGCSMLSSVDLVNLESFARKLKTPEDDVSKHLKTKLHPATCDALSKYQGGNDLPLREMLVEDINKVIAEERIWDDDRCANVSLSEDLRKGLTQRQEGAAMERMNVTILASVYSVEISSNVRKTVDKAYVDNLLAYSKSCEPAIRR